MVPNPISCISDNHLNIVFCSAQNITQAPKTCENGNLVFWYKVNFHSNDIDHQKSLSILLGWYYKLWKLLFSLISVSVGIFIRIYIFVQMLLNGSNIRTHRGEMHKIGLGRIGTRFKALQSNTLQRIAWNWYKMEYNSNLCIRWGSGVNLGETPYFRT